jgi:hypothetical protein
LNGVHFRAIRRADVKGDHDLAARVRSDVIEVPVNGLQLPTSGRENIEIG